MLNEIIVDAEKKFKTATDHLAEEYATIRSSHTSPSLVENIKVKAYDAEYTLKELAAITVPEPNMIMVQPWDQTVVQNIETAIIEANLGLNPSVDQTTIRIPVPMLSEERRLEMIKRVNTVTESARVAVRNIRQDKIKSIENLEEEGKISEDERDQSKKEIQRLVDTTNEKIEAVKDAKIEALQS